MAILRHPLKHLSSCTKLVSPRHRLFVGRVESNILWCTKVTGEGTLTVYYARLTGVIDFFLAHDFETAVAKQKKAFAYYALLYTK